jgi:hypothetical protein
MSETPQRPRIWVDFQNTDTQGAVRLTSAGTITDLNNLGLILHEGIEVTLYCLELEADGVVSYSQEEKRWIAKVDWDKIRNRRTGSANP